MSGRFIPPFQNKPLGSLILLFTGVSIISFSLLSIIAPFLMKWLFGISSFNMASLMINPDNQQLIGALKLMQFIQAIGLFILPPFVMAILTDKEPMKWLGLHKFNQTVPILIFACLMMVCAQPFINWMASANELIPVSDWMLQAEKQTQQLTKAFLTMDDYGDLLVNLLLVGLLPGIGEELFFRGVMQPLFYRLSNNHHLAIWSTGFIFSAMHMQFLGFIPRMLLGVGLGYIRYWTNSIWASIVAHTLNNALAVYLYFLVQHQMLTPRAEGIGSERGDLLWVLVSAFFTLLFLSLIQAWAAKDQNQGNISKLGG
jgi:hypothetical protein